MSFSDDVVNQFINISCCSDYRSLLSLVCHQYLFQPFSLISSPVKITKERIFANCNVILLNPLFVLYFFILGGIFILRNFFECVLRHTHFLFIFNVVFNLFENCVCLLDCVTNSDVNNRLTFSCEAFLIANWHILRQDDCVAACNFFWCNFILPDFSFWWTNKK